MPMTTQIPRENTLIVIGGDGTATIHEREHPVPATSWQNPRPVPRPVLPLSVRIANHARQFPDDTRRKCGNCRQRGHDKRACREPVRVGTNRCGFCRQRGHTFPTCPENFPTREREREQRRQQRMRGDDADFEEFLRTEHPADFLARGLGVVTAPRVPPPRVPPPVEPTPLSSTNECVACYEFAKTTLLLPCRHLCLCSKCGHHPEMRKCPICRTVITERIDAFV